MAALNVSLDFSAQLINYPALKLVRQVTLLTYLEQ